jgi:hypothetical protein
MEPKDCDALSQPDRSTVEKRPWTAPKVIVSESIARGVQVKTNHTLGIEQHTTSSISTS